MKFPGFIDIQVNGYMGLDFSSPTLVSDDVPAVSRMLADKGTCAYCPTVCTSPLDVYEQNLRIIGGLIDDDCSCDRILGIHLEGPFISPEPGARGAHRSDCVISPSVDIFKRFMDWASGHISILTIAPELPQAIDLIEYAVSAGVNVSIGHSIADRDLIEDAVSAGASCSTHLGNGIPNMLPRHNNPIWYQLAQDRLMASFITDGHHIPPDFIKIAIRAKGIDRFIVVSDAAPLAGLPAGRYSAFGKDVVIEPSGRIYCPETDGLAGSHSIMIECMNHLASLRLFSADELYRVCVTNPLKFLGLDEDCLNHDSETNVIFKENKFFVIDK